MVSRNPEINQTILFFFRKLEESGTVFTSESVLFYECQKTEQLRTERKEGKMIWEELSEDLVFDSLDAKNTDEIFEQVGGRFIAKGYCKPSYIKALKERESDFPTGLDMGGLGIAIPHTDISHVNKSGIAIARLNTPVEFIQMGTDDEMVHANLVFMLSVKDPGAHMQVLQRIVEIIQDREVLEGLMHSADTKSMIGIIHDKENRLDHLAA